MLQRRRHRCTLLEIPSDHGVPAPRSATTLVGHASLPEPALSRMPPEAATPSTEEVYVSPSGRVFLPPGFDFERGRPRAVTRRSACRQPAPPRPEPRRAHVAVQGGPMRRRVITRESWVLPEIFTVY